MLELYNTTGEIRRIPRYRYNGKYVIQPRGTAGPIEEEQAYFFKPFSKVGVVVRQVVSPLNVEISNGIEKSFSDSKCDADLQLKDSTSDVVESDNEVEEIVSDKKYSESDLSELSRSSLRNIADSLGIDASKIKSKEDIRKLILGSQV